MIRRDIIFTYNKSLYIECPPYFKIHKCPDNFPHPPFEMAHHPYFIEYEVEKASPKKGLKSGIRQIQKDNKYSDFEEEEISPTFLQMEQNNRTRNEFVSLLNALTNNYVFTYGTQVRQGWTINLSENDDKPSYSQEGYRSPEYDSEINEINFTGSHRVLGLLLQLIDSEGNVVRDIGLKDLISIYASIKDPQCKTDFLNACVVFNKAQYLAPCEISASYIFMVASIEALIEMEHRGGKVENCSSCGQPKYQVNKKFKEFVDKYGYKIDNKTKNEFYGLRSKIAHSGQLLASSYDSKFFVDSQKDLDNEYLYHEHRRTYDRFKNLTQVCFSKFLLNLE